MNEVVIIGVGMTRFGIFADKTLIDLGREATDAALTDAGLAWHDLQYIIGGIDPYSGFPGISFGSVLQAEIGYNGIPATSVWNACATGAHTLDLGRALILSQLYDTVLCVGSFKAPGGFFPTMGSADDPANLDAQRFRLLGKTNPSMFAFQAVRRMHNYGMTEEDIALVKVKNSKHGCLNPNARFQRQFTMEEVMASPMVAYPLRLFEIAATSDGAAAVVLCSRKKAKELGVKGVELSAVCGSAPRYPNTDIGVTPFATQSEVSTGRTPDGAERAHECQVARGALEEAGIGPEDLSLAEVYDLSCAMEFDWMEDIGVCKPGEAERLLRDGATTIGGRIPINTSGGVASFGESVPAQALLQTCELVLQLRGDAGPRQVEGATVGLAINKGLANSIACVVVKR
jgi:acetyl-CoA acetyltransferase